MAENISLLSLFPPTVTQHRLTQYLDATLKNKQMYFLYPENL